jgi:hypothetical protein
MYLGTGASSSSPGPRTSPSTRTGGQALEMMKALTAYMPAD